MKIDIIGSFESFYLKLPKLSDELRLFVVRVLPYISLLAGILITFASIMEILGTPFISVFTLGQGTLIQTLLLINVIGIIQGVMMIFAFPHLRKTNFTGWKLLFWSQFLWVASALISLSPTFILGLLFLYPLFQVKSHYK